VKKHIVLYFVLVALIGCSSESIKITNPMIEVYSVSQQNDEALLFSGTYLSFRFYSESTEIDTSNIDLQAIATLIKNDKEIGSSTGLGGVFTVKNNEIVLGVNGPNYIALNFNDLNVLSDAGTSTLLKDIDFDRIEFRLRYPEMIRFSLLSNVVSFSKGEVLKALNEAPEK